MTRMAAPSIKIPGFAILGWVAFGFINLVRAMRDRREVMHLTEFDDRMLKDIGLTRITINGALAGPIHLKPSWYLVRNADQVHSSEAIVEPSRRRRPLVPMKQLERCA